ncbi:MAG TPA: hypothetical protein VJJ98_13585 [Sedimentisphaerales bacterium]|nr:hypothetical protein [Sedimentisphaerales bacterium]
MNSKLPTFIRSRPPLSELEKQALIYAEHIGPPTPNESLSISCSGFPFQQLNVTYLLRSDAITMAATPAAITFMAATLAAITVAITMAAAHATFAMTFAIPITVLAIPVTVMTGTFGVGNFGIGDTRIIR